ncbi:phosphotransferase [Paenibacillus sp. J22TS3]|uniref:phosphotransferase n=1 Tax=Paenibacillus sp. J22TS3 TaxID=2807192 RepID=UPI001B12FABC|nr:phosphotransferase [Paenibacillus sp. J22TS3]GIP22140.1 spore coat protein [Paenibacillus sp. J22TS3]
MSLKLRVEQQYGLKIKDIQQVKDVYKLRTSDKVYCLKGYAFPEEEVRFITRMFTFMAEKGFTRGQKVYPTVEQSLYMTYEGNLYTLTNWVVGQRPIFTKRRDFRNGLRTLAKFHSMANGFPITEAPESRIRYWGLGSEISDYQQLLSQYKETRHLASRCEEVADFLQQPQSLEAIRAEQETSAFIHGDYNYPNLIKSPRGKLHLIDFDNTSLHTRMKDLSHLLHRNCGWNGVRMLRSIDYYQRHRQLSASDARLLYALLCAPYHVVRNIRIGGIRSAKPLIVTSAQFSKYQRELRSLL